MIAVSKPLFGKNATKYLKQCITSGWVSSHGPFVQKFEESFAKYLGVKYAATSTSGTAALHLALAALGIGPGDEVIISAFTMIAPVFAVLYLGAKPVFVDIESLTWNMDPDQIEKNITKQTKAIIAVHIYGHSAEIDQLKKIAKKYHLYLIEDGAEALGSEYKGKKVGSFGDISCFSFYANKLITTGEGGMVVTNNKRLYKKLLGLKDMSHSPRKRFLHLNLGFTYRFSNLQAALGLAQLEIINKLLAKKRQIAKIYQESLSIIPSLELPQEKKMTKHSYWVCGVLIKQGNKLALRKNLLKHGIDTRDFFIPMHRQPILKKLGLVNDNKFPVADYVSDHGFYIPSGPNISKAEIKKVCDIIKRVCGYSVGSVKVKQLNS